MRIPFPLGLEEDYTLSPKGAGYHFVPRTGRSISHRRGIIHYQHTVRIIGITILSNALLP